MKKQLTTWMACSALLLSSATTVLAQPGQDREHHRQDQVQQSRDRGRNGQDQGRHAMYDRGRHDGWYRKGGHVPPEYRGRGYVVSDWRSRHLRQPPRGYHYVRSDNGDYLLVAISTGIIMSILARH